ncbi:MAG: UDP-N-acetylmuramate dehydrogenase [Clostridia bacterium]|nr:UDP-N-acetylmuramate dehydrogenase [Clostridia bacterium]
MGFKDELLEFTHAKIRFNEPMKRHTALGVGGKAKYFAEVDSLYGLNLLTTLAQKHRVKYKVIGNGTNVLVSDNGYEGIIICLKKLSDVFFKRDEVRAMAGANLDKLIKFTLDHRLTGLEALSGIPATVGGAVVMNAGAFGHNISDRITTVETLCGGKIKIYDKEDCKFSYRKSRFLGKKETVVSASFKLDGCERDAVMNNIKKYRERRKNVQPTGKSCGSVFKNPTKYSAGALIDKAGLKGYTLGGAKVSERHGNFILTDSRATASDVYALIQYIKEEIFNIFGVRLSEEVEYIGEF